MIERRLKRYFISKIRKWSRDNPLEFPWRTTQNQWHALVAEIMLQRTKAEQVLPIFNDFVKRFPSPLDYLRYQKEFEENIFEKLGLKWRSRAFNETVREIVEEGIPLYKSELTKLPGIGDYVSSAFLSFHLNKREILIDSNIVRFYGRFFGMVTNNETRRKKEFRILAEEVTPMRYVKSFNYAVLDFSMNICKHNPQCEVCVVCKKCMYKENSKKN